MEMKFRKYQRLSKKRSLEKIEMKTRKEKYFELAYYWKVGPLECLGCFVEWCELGWYLMERKGAKQCGSVEEKESSWWC